MKRVVTGPLHERNNDLAIALLNPIPQNHIDFEEIRQVIVHFMTIQNDFPYHQRCPYGQVYVRFAYHHHRDFLIHGSPHPCGNGTIIFIPHNWGWNNRTLVVTHEVWMMMIGLNIDIWDHALVDKVVSEFGRLLA